MVTSYARLSGGREIRFAGRRTEQNQVFENPSGRLGLNACDRGRIATESYPEIDQPVGAERQYRLARAGVDFLQMVVDREDEPPILPILALPVGDAAARQTRKVLVDPDLLARCGVERDERAVPRQHIHHVVDDDGVEDVGAGVAGRIDPGDLQLADVGLRGLIERDEMRRIRAAAVGPPGTARRYGAGV